MDYFNRRLGRTRRSDSDPRDRTPAMIGDCFGGVPTSLSADSVLDRLVIVANDLYAPVALPPGAFMLTITDGGPISVFDTSLQSVQQLQALLRGGNPLPGFTLAGTLPDDATLTTLNTISQIQSQLAGTGADSLMCLRRSSCFKSSERLIKA